MNLNFIYYIWCIISYKLYFINFDFINFNFNTNTNRGAVCTRISRHDIYHISTKTNTKTNTNANTNTKTNSNTDTDVCTRISWLALYHISTKTGTGQGSMTGSRKQWRSNKIQWKRNWNWKKKDEGRNRARVNGWKTMEERWHSLLLWWSIIGCHFEAALECNKEPYETVLALNSFCYIFSFR